MQSHGVISGSVQYDVYTDLTNPLCIFRLFRVVAVILVQCSCLLWNVYRYALCTF